MIPEQRLLEWVDEQISVTSDNGGIAMLESLRNLIQSGSLSSSSPPAHGGILSGRWHHGNGYLCLGTIRVARASFDTITDLSKQDEFFQAMCDALNSLNTRTASAPQSAEQAGVES
jgi:hypothetical protein